MPPARKEAGLTGRFCGGNFADKMWNSSFTYVFFFQGSVTVEVMFFFFFEQLYSRWGRGTLVTLTATLGKERKTRTKENVLCVMVDLTPHYSWEWHLPRGQLPNLAGLPRHICGRPTTRCLLPHKTTNAVLLQNTPQKIQDHGVFVSLLYNCYMLNSIFLNGKKNRILNYSLYSFDSSVYFTWLFLSLFPLNSLFIFFFRFHSLLDFLYCCCLFISLNLELA